MILDTSAVVAIIHGEDNAAALADAVEAADQVRISAASVVEASLVLGPDRQDLLDEFLRLSAAKIVAVDAEQSAIARSAHLRFGRGSGSSARLNFGDCFSYALATAADDALLFKGDDFTHTDVRSAKSDS